MVIQGTELLVEEGVRVEITCQAQGRPQPEVSLIMMMVAIIIMMMMERMVMMRKTAIQAKSFR